MFHSTQSDDHFVEGWYFGIVIWILALRPSVLLFRALQERIRGKNRLVIDAEGITLQSLGCQPIAWSQVDCVEVQIKQTMEYAGRKNFTINLLRCDYKVYHIQLNDKGQPLAFSSQPIAIVPIELSVSEAQVEAALAQWLTLSITE